MEIFRVSLLIFIVLVHVSNGQLAPSETRILFQIQKLLEYPQVLQGWNNWTNFCYLPSSESLKIVCSNGHVTELTVIGNKSSPSKSPKPLNSSNFAVSRQSLSKSFSIDAFFTVLTKLSNLEVLSLVSLGLWGPLPEKINRFWSLEVLNVSSNFIYGKIPQQIGTLMNLSSLILADNLLNGNVPDVVCNSRLKLLNISHNLLIGKLPSCTASSSSNRTVISSWNCLSDGNLRNQQHPFSFCQKEALAVKPRDKEKENEKEKEKSVSKLGLILAVIGVSVGISLVLGLSILVIVRRSKRRNNDREFDGYISNKMPIRSSSSSVPTMDSRRVPQTMRSAAIGLSPYRVFALDEIEHATNNFDTENFIGEGSQGQVYKGCLEDGSMVVIKCIKLKQKNLAQNLVQHMEVISKLRHVHLVSVLGHCIVTYQDHPVTSSTVFVVFEHIYNASLYTYLSDSRRKEMMKWPQRMAITIGVARGIQFLHTGVALGIFGNDIKIENVMLDDCLTAKLSNYNIPLPSKGGSESPLNGKDNNFSTKNAEKEDVYQLGLILLQIITGKIVKSTADLDELKIQLEKNLSEAPSKLRGMADPSTRGTFAYESLITAVKITMNCLSKEASNRPSIEDVLWNLQYSSQVQEGWTSSGNLGS
ncbi:probable LRR receptor-like serine/threonine-protein kinase At1g14390 [Euphorbia lathyris]|uniref:probable LRR receptor-like serine/threonine-protein kinase At1g14390 n=1 Tax=Euphorbia lathyris TaxID=212925 RepID=UPI00331364AD